MDTSGLSERITPTGLRLTALKRTDFIYTRLCRGARCGQRQRDRRYARFTILSMPAVTLVGGVVIFRD